MAGERELIARGIDAYNRGDLEGMVEACDPEVVLVPVRARLEGGEYSGHEGLRRFLADMEEDWSARRIEVDELRDLGDSLLLLGSFVATGRSGVEVDYPVAWHARFRDGRLVRLVAFTDRDEALRELGGG